MLENGNNEHSNDYKVSIYDMSKIITFIAVIALIIAGVLIAEKMVLSAGSTIGQRQRGSY